MNFSIVIPTYRRPILLNRILSSLVRAARPSSLLEVIVVENGGIHGAEKICGEFAASLPIVCIHEAEPGLSNARNLGVEKARGDIVLFLDDDIRVHEQTLTAYDEAFRRHGDTAFYGGPLECDYEAQPPDWLTDLLPPSARGWSLGDAEQEITEPCLLGGNMAVPRAAFDRAGGFDPVCATGADDGGTGEEMRLQVGLLEQGSKGIFVPGALVGHYVPADRCDKAFIRHRRWRRGFGFGQLYAVSDEPHSNILGAPRWWWRWAARSLLQLAGSTLLLRSRKQRFFRLILTIEAFGWLKGYRTELTR